MTLAFCFQSILDFRRSQRGCTRTAAPIVSNLSSIFMESFDHSRSAAAWLRLFIASSACSGFIFTALMADESKPASEGFGLLAHWSFDEDYSSTVNNDLYHGKPSGGDFISIVNDRSTARIGTGALRLDSGPRSGNKTYVSIRNPLFGYHNAEVFTLVAWYRYDDLSGDGSDARNFIWESTPAYSLAFGLRQDQDQRDAEWWFQTASHSTISDVTGPEIKANQWYHTAIVWNRNEGHAKFYHNGSLRDDVALPEGELLEEMSGFHIGNHRGGDGARDWDGYIDDVLSLIHI